MKQKDNIIRRILIILIALVAVIFILIKSQNYIKESTEGEINLIINNNNVTERLKNEVKIKDGIVYLSMDDIKNFFDKYIYIEEEINEVVTTYDKKIASIGFDVNKLTINGAIKKIYASAINEDETVYLPISEMTDVYNIELSNIEEKKIVTIDSLNREQTKAYTKSKLSVKWKKDIFSKTVDNVSKGDIVIAITKDEDGWAKIRTENGEVGYVKANKLTNFTTIREELETEQQVTGKVNMFWDYFSQYVQAPDRTGQTVEGVNVVSPSFFYIDANGNLKDNVGTSGQAYIEWAHSNGYKVWPMVSNAEAGIKVTSSILNSYTKRQELIESIVEKCVEYGIDGINMDFENMYEADKDKYSRLIIELVPRMQELGAVTSVDVTAPDGDPNWSLCYDRNIIGDVADYLVFMAYDQYGVSSTKPGTTAGYNWIETSLNKIIEYDEVDTQKIILGMPFYTRQWTLDSSGNITDRSIVSMMNIKIPNNVEKQWDEDLKQYYIEYASGKNIIKMWIEDGTSITAKVSLVSKYNLGGTSCWRKDMETSNIWTIIKEGLN
jgi:spore germination protein YaaH